MNAIALLKADHRTVEDLFDQLEALASSSRGRKHLVEKLVRALSIHAAIEEELFYPLVKKTMEDARELVLEALEGHNVVKWLLAELESMDVGDERFEAKLKVLRDNVLRHVEEEENLLFPRVRARFGLARLNALGTALEKAKRTAPTHPHPRAPDEPPANIPMNMGAAMMDRLRDAARAIGHRSTGEARGSERASSPRRAGRATSKRGPATKRASSGGRRGSAGADRSRTSRAHER